MKTERLGITMLVNDKSQLKRNVEQIAIQLALKTSRESLLIWQTHVGIGWLLASAPIPVHSMYLYVTINVYLCYQSVARQNEQQLTMCMASRDTLASVYEDVMKSSSATSLTSLLFTHTH